MLNNHYFENLKGVSAILNKIRDNISTIFIKDDSVLDTFSSDQYEQLLQESETLMKRVKFDVKKHPSDLSEEQINLAKRIEQNIINLGKNIHEIGLNISTDKRRALILDCYRDIDNTLLLIND